MIVFFYVCMWLHVCMLILLSNVASLSVRKKCSLTAFCVAGTLQEWCMECGRQGYLVNSLVLRKRKFWWVLCYFVAFWPTLCLLYICLPYVYHILPYTWFNSLFFFLSGVGSPFHISGSGGRSLSSKGDWATGSGEESSRIDHGTAAGLEIKLHDVFFSQKDPKWNMFALCLKHISYSLLISFMTWVVRKIYTSEVVNLSRPVGFLLTEGSAHVGAFRRPSLRGDRAGADRQSHWHQRSGMRRAAVAVLWKHMIL